MITDEQIAVLFDYEAWRVQNAGKVNFNQSPVQAYVAAANQEEAVTRILAALDIADEEGSTKEDLLNILRNGVTE